ncbi:MAG: hypothetical protein M3O09_03265 [Acidobacteriota bacterium]|nr:hypothetical protein [Acidobacteriota bacterium]
MTQNGTDRIVGACVDLEALLRSVPRSVNITRYYQTVKSIQVRAAAADAEGLHQLWDELFELKDQLKFADADDGKKILNPERHKNFLFKLDSY